MHSRYYLTGHTAKGTVRFLPNELKDVKRIILINEPSLTWSTHILKGIINKFKEEDVEIFLSPSGADYIEGILLKEHSVAIVARTVASFDLQFEQSNVISLTIRDLINIHLEKDGYSEELIADLVKRYDEKIHKAYDSFGRGLKIHDELEAIYIKEIDRAKANQLAKKIVLELLKGIPKQEKIARVSHRFFGTNTPEGTVNVIPEILERVEKSHFIHGRAGTGKSTLMKHVAKECLEKGLDIELYHCSFDPDSIDMVLVPSIKYCIFDATPPHEFEPNKQSEKVIDTYAEFVTPGTDEKYAGEIETVTRRYKEAVQEGSYYIKEAGKIMEQIEKPFTKHLASLDKLKHDIINQIVRKAEVNI